VATIASPTEGVLGRYRQARAVSRQINTLLTKQLDREVLQEGARRLGMLRNDIMCFSTEDESCVLMDYCIYDCRREGENAIQRLVKSERSFSPEEEAHLQHMLKAWYTVISVEAVRPGVGVKIIDILRGQRRMLVDEGFSRTALPGVAIATRLIPYPDFVMTAGAALPLDDASLFKLRDGVKANMNWLLAPNEMSHEEQARLSAKIIRCALAGEASSRIRYEDAGPLRFGGPRLQGLGGPYPHRNAKCPCGSGRKYKNCCGRG
jgi:hypothetical protein